MIRIHSMPYIGGQPLPRGLFSRPAISRKSLGSPRSVTSRRSLDFTGRWVTLSSFCANPEGVGVARGGGRSPDHSLASSAGAQTTVATVCHGDTCAENSRSKPHGRNPPTPIRLSAGLDGSAPNARVRPTRFGDSCAKHRMSPNACQCSKSQSRQLDAKCPHFLMFAGQYTCLLARPTGTLA